MAEDKKLKDTGERISYGEGKAVREPSTGKGRFDLISPIAVQRVLAGIENSSGYYDDVLYRHLKDDLMNIIYNNLYKLALTQKGYDEEGFDYLAYTLYCAMELYELEYNGHYYISKEILSIPPTALKAIARHYEQGAEKYAEYNWAKGIPMSRCLDSAIRHFGQYQQGLTDEPHLSACMWNICALLHYEIMMPSMNNLHEWERDKKDG
jgi:hypothetical protein